MKRITRHPRFPHWFVAINALVIFVGMAVIGFLVYIDGSAPLKLFNTINGEVPTVEPHVDSQGNFVLRDTFSTGEAVTYGIEYCKDRRVPATVRAFFVDTAMVEMPAVESNWDAGCGKLIIDDFVVPRFLPTGSYYLRVEVEYRVNPLRTVKVEYRTTDFTIINTVKN